MTRLQGKHAFLQQLVADGVRYIFGNPGTTEQAFVDALPQYPQLGAPAVVDVAIDGRVR